MTPATKIDFEKFSQNFDEITQKVLKIFADHHVEARVVGGAVRDFLRNKAPRDIDLLVADDPSETLYLLEMYNIPTDVGGIAHGTIKAVSGYGKKEVKLDITSLGYRIRLQGKTPHITHERNWQRDSAMRDLSINSMSMDMRGNIWDYQDGIPDLQKNRIRMLPYTRDHVQDDPNTIMRYFKALTYFSNPLLVRDDLEFLKSHVGLLEKSKDDERLTKNLISIQSAPNGKNIIKLMCSMGIKRYLSALPCDNREE